MTETISFPVYSYREVGLFQEIVHDILSERENSFYQTVQLCGEIDDFLMETLKASGPFLIQMGDRIVLPDARAGFGADRFQSIKVKESSQGVEIKPRGLELKEEEKKQFSTRQTARQKSGYVKLLNESLRRKNEQIEKMYESKSYLLNFLAHELRNPLTAILNSVELMRTAPEEVEQLALDKVLENVSSDMKKLVDEVLEFSRVESGKLKIERTGVYIKEFCEEFSSYGRALAESKSLEWKTEGIENASDTRVWTDPFRARQILSNLVGNALKFTSSGHIGFGVETSERKAVFGVHDTGKGIAQKYQDSVFQEFSQESAAISKEFGGSGLGLSICFNMAKEMGGRLWFESEEGKGTSFYLALPLEERPRQARPWY